MISLLYAGAAVILAVGLAELTVPEFGEEDVLLWVVVTWGITYFTLCACLFDVLQLMAVPA